MTKYDLGLPAERFIAAALELTADDWTQIVDRGRDLGEAKRDAMDAVEDSMSAAERSAFDKRRIERVGTQLQEVFDELSLRTVGRARIAFSTSVFALQKRDVIPEEVLRTWFGPFESVGIRLETLLEENE